MDIVLEQLMQYVDQIAGLVSDSAPMVWEVFLKQVHVQMAGYGLLALALVGIAWFTGTKFRKAEIDQTGDGSLSVWLVLVSLGGAGGSVYAVIARLINPSWYAIKLLLETAGIGG